MRSRIKIQQDALAPLTETMKNILQKLLKSESNDELSRSSGSRRTDVKYCMANTGKKRDLTEHFWITDNA